jgi:hypothetical protein
MTKQLGPTFGNEVNAAPGLNGVPIAWGDTDDSITGRENLSSEQNTTLDGVVAAHDPTKLPPNVITTQEFISRWTNAEYLALEKLRRDDIAANKVGNAKNWDVVIADDTVDLAKQKTVNLKADLVQQGILTQARADAIFGAPPTET